MDSTCSITKRQRLRLDASLKQWMAKADGGLPDPRKESLVWTTLKVLGFDELVQQEEDRQELVDKLALLNEQVLNRVSPGSDMDAVTRRLITVLIKVVGEVESYLRRRKFQCGFAAELNRSNAIRNLNTKLDSVTGLLNTVRMTEVVKRVDRLEDVARSPITPTYPILTAPEIPPKPAIFCGRDDLIETIVHLLLQPSPCRIPLLGPGGIGKTSVAAVVMNDIKVRTKFGSRLLFVSCEGVISAEGIVQALVSALGLQHDSNPRRSLFAYLSSGGAVLLVLDNLETAWDSADKIGVEQLLSRLADITALSLIITMRGEIRPAGVDWAQSCREPLVTLSLEAARQMWLRISGTSDKKLDELLSLMDGLPLAIYLMAHQGQALDPDELLDAYRAEKTALMKDGGVGRLASLEASIQLSLNSRAMSENPHARSLLSHVCLLPDGVPTKELARMLPSMKNVRAAILALLHAALAVKHKGRLRVLSPIRDFILAHHPPSGPCLSELRTFVQNLTLQMQTSKIGTIQAKNAVDMLSTEFGNINSVLLHFWRAPPRTQDVDALQAATRQFATFSHLASHGDCAQLLREAGTRLETIGNWPGVAECTQRIGDILSSQDRYEDAVEKLQEAKMMFESVGHRSDAAQCTRSIGDLLRMRNHYTAAIAELEEAMTVFVENGDKRGAAQCTQSMGDLLRMMDRYVEAFKKLAEAKAQFVANNDSLGAAQCTLSMGEVLRAVNRNEEAVRMLADAKETFDGIGNRRGAAQCMRSQGDALRMLKRYNEALPKLVEAKAVFAEIGNRLGAAQCMLIIGNVLRMECRYEKAIDNLEEARAVFTSIGCKLGVAECNRSLPFILIKIDRMDEANHMLQEAMEIYRQLGLRKQMQYCQEVMMMLEFPSITRIWSRRQLAEPSGAELSIGHQIHDTFSKLVHHVGSMCRYSVT
ncbi:hypothetical protein CALVIDRAFT_522998 [Calocera viscosa TUFC12733]|uniref:NB-ARC domain-containing protein n=1 Tax=Calocera viscosa (strain TUFC12733) TaxID=1330018 RepID=A0A167G821_CALVF|nr:hypothetical protein CALVIDRAFT_522998 [Calocera viscosa TUFC12733]